ncbi:MAG: plastocyanin/azurin family copper-binding protein [Gemmatimonadota bacterium]
MRRFVLPGMLLIACLVLASCTSERSGSVEPNGEDSSQGGAGTVVIRLTESLQFQPASIEIDPGTTVRWVNDAAIFHTVTPNNARQPGVWARRGMTTAGETFSHTFATGGQSYTYHCEPHEALGMRGTVRVR